MKEVYALNGIIEIGDKVVVQDWHGLTAGTVERFTANSVIIITNFIHNRIIAKKFAKTKIYLI